MTKITKRGSGAARLLATGLIAGTTLGGIVAMPTAALAQEAAQDTPRSYDIRAGSLTDALHQLAEQGGLQINYDAGLIDGRTTSGVRGRVNRREALTRLLAGTDLAARVTGTDAMTIVLASTDRLDLDPMQVRSAVSDSSREARRLQQEGTVDTSAVSEIVVTATSVATIDSRPLIDTPRTVQAVSGRLLEQTSPGNLQDLVRNFAALIQSNGPEDRIPNFISRGVGTSVRRNGLPIVRVAFPLEDIEQLELLQGVGDATQAGDKSPGGIVNFVSKKPQMRDFTRLNFVATEYGNLLGQADVNLALGDRTAVRANVGLERIRFANDTDGSRQSIILAVRREIAHGLNLDLSGIFSNSPNRQQFVGYIPLDPATGQPPQLSYRKRYGQKWNHNNFQTSFVEAGLNGDLGNGWSLSLGGNYFEVRERSSRETLFGSFPDASGNADVLALHSDQNFFGGNARGSLTKELAITTNVVNRTTLVADYTHYRLDYFFQRTLVPGFNLFGSVDVPEPAFSNGPLNRGNGSTTSGLALQNELTLFDRLTLQLGVRRYHSKQKNYDNTPQNNVVDVSQVNEWLPNYSAIFKVTPTVSIYGSSYLAIEPGQVVRFQYINFGEQLPPLKARSLEIGTKYQRGALVASLSYFRFKRSSLLQQSATDTNGNPGFILTQSGSTRYQGLDFSLSGQPTSQLTVVTSASFVDAKILRADDPALIGKEPTAVPRFAASVFAEYEMFPGWFLSGAMKHSGRQQSLADNSAQIRGYTLFDLGIRHEDVLGTRPVRLGFFVQNLTDKFYFAAANQSASVNLGTPRVMKASFGIDF